MCCDNCCCSYHPECVGLDPDNIPSFNWNCPQHECAECGRKAASAGGLLFRCVSCPQAFCEDHLPVTSKLLKGWEPYQALGQVQPKQACFCYCSSGCQEFGALKQKLESAGKSILDCRSKDVPARAVDKVQGDNTVTSKFCLAKPARKHKKEITTSPQKQKKQKTAAHQGRAPQNDQVWQYTASNNQTLRQIAKELGADAHTLLELNRHRYNGLTLSSKLMAATMISIPTTSPQQKTAAHQVRGYPTTQPLNHSTRSGTGAKTRQTTESSACQTQDSCTHTGAAT